jgi:uncharacterized protein involved in outer membrane biogenesis
MRPVPLLLVGAAVILAVIWIGPRLLDWNTHRDAIEAAASGFLGRDVEISGPIRLSLLPEPPSASRCATTATACAWAPTP